MRLSPTGSRRGNLFSPALLIALALAFLLRMLVTWFTVGFSTDYHTFLAWALQLADVGPANFYAEGYFADYPPGYMVILWLVGKVIRAGGLAWSETATRLLMAFAPALADLGIGVVLYLLARPRLGEKQALWLGCVVLFNPLLWYDCAVWKQVDSILALLLLCCFWALSRRRFAAAGLLYGAALLAKPQALMFGPVFALCFLLPFFWPKNAHQRAQTAKGAALAFFCCIGLMALVSLPFTGSQTPFLWLVEKYTVTASSYPYGSVNACNLQALLGGNWVSLDTVFWGLSRRSWGILGIGGTVLFTGWLAFISWRRGRFCPFLLAGLFGCGVFTLGHSMHERYLLPAVVFLFAAFLFRPDRRLFAVAVCESLSCLGNMALVLHAVDSGDSFLQAASTQWLVGLLSLAQVVLFLYLARLCVQLGLQGDMKPARPFRPHRFGSSDAARFGGRPVPPFARRDRVFLALLTLAVGVVSLSYLGDTKAPQNGLSAKSDSVSVTVTFRDDVSIGSLFFYPGIGEGSVVVTNGSGTLEAQVGVYTVYIWNQSAGTALEVPAGAPVTITLSQGVTLNELALLSLDKTPLIPAAVSPGGEALFDEQSLVPQRATQLNGMYFDEIYHARTAFELLHGLPVYETTHPPLGKDLIALGIALFGMTPFGWRVVGALFGVAMVPVLYLLALQLLKSHRWARFAAVLFALDGMRFVQSRIATIDVYVVFFILLGSYFMVKGCRGMVQKGTAHALGPLFLGGFSMGLACASKWTGAYAGVGFAVFYFGALWARRLRLAAAGPGGKAVFRRDLLLALAAGIAFFVVVPVVVYLLSYLPYFLRPGSSFGLAQLWQCQKTMFAYHSRLTATHPFQSVWYSWLVIWRPVWYYMGTGLSDGVYSSIAVLGNPVLWWGGLFAVLCLVLRALRGRLRPGGSFVLLSWAAQLMPWVLVTRAVFLYHYFACVPFLALALGWFFQAFSKRHPLAVRRTAIGLCAAAGVLFCFFYPVFSGLPVSRAWAAATLWLPGWGFYIL